MLHYWLVLVGSHHLWNPQLQKQLQSSEERMQIPGTFRKNYLLKSSLRYLHFEVIFPHSLPNIRMFSYLFSYICRFWLIHLRHHHILLDLRCIPSKRKKRGCWWLVFLVRGWSCVPVWTYCWVGYSEPAIGFRILP